MIAVTRAQIACDLFVKKITLPHGPCDTRSLTIISLKIITDRGPNPLFRSTVGARESARVEPDRRNRRSIVFFGFINNRTATEKLKKKKPASKSLSACVQNGSRVLFGF